MESKLVPEKWHYDDNKIAPEQAISANEISSKVYNSKTYDKPINKPIHVKRWKEATEDEIQNQESHHTWEYNSLPSEKRVVELK